eukprot:TRINITY_DN4344_c0_g1_i1.p1 TRINITY_DN4344_c0_g1~~TRINITY_DN4344_c0_g1_i1.p1  ORF type:complete len:336 (-),score=49.92 TRINITY_DN4344_c0_g1_i1:42-1049(-)
MDEVSFNKDHHIRFFMNSLNCLPSPYQSSDPNRLTILYFCVSALDILGASDKLPKQDIINWVMATYIETADGRAGFRGGTFWGAPFSPALNKCMGGHDNPHLANTYCALCILAILRHNFEGISIEKVLKEVSCRQAEDGGFFSSSWSVEKDIRFTYSALAICKILRSFEGVNREQAAKYILSCQQFDGALGQEPGNEGHGGVTFCGVAALSVLNKLDEIQNPDQLLRWTAMRVVSGYQGRLHKPADTCYSWWIGASQQILGEHLCAPVPFALPEHVIPFNLSCCSKYGGFGKHPDTFPDLMHSYLTIAGMSLLGQFDLLPLDTVLNISKEAAKAL